MNTLSTRGRAAFLLAIGSACLLLQAADLAAESVTLAWDPSPSPNVVGYYIHYGYVTGNYTNRITLTNVTHTVIPQLDAGATYFFIATAYDSLGEESDPSNEVSYTVPVTQTHAPPTLDPLDNLAINENAGARKVNLTGISSGATNEDQTLTIDAISSNPQLIPKPTITYTSPDSSGTLTLGPAANSYGSAVLTVTVSDGSTANGTVSRSFTVAVRSAISQVSIGNANVQTGRSGSVALGFGSANSLATLDLRIGLPAGYLTNFTLQGLAPEIDPTATSCSLLQDSSLLLHFAAKPGQTLVGGNAAAELAFIALDGQPSAFVPLQLLGTVGSGADGTKLTNWVSQSGRVVVLGREALLETSKGSGPQPSLTLYGLPNSTYALEYSTDLVHWTRMPEAITLQSYSATPALPQSSGSQIFYRAVELSTAQTGP